jgi:hypothetical protein
MVLSELAPVVITTCVGYWDYLDATLPHTLEFASKVYIVTDEPRILEKHRSTSRESSGKRKSACTQPIQTAGSC